MAAALASITGIVKAKEPKFYGPPISDLVPLKREGQAVMYDAEELMPFKYPFTPARHAWLEQQQDKYWEQQWLISELEEARSARLAELGVIFKATGLVPSAGA